MKKTLIFFSFLMTMFLANTLPAAELGDIEIHGFISQGYLLSNKNNYLAETEDGTFQFNEMGINFSTDLTDTLRIGMQFFARDLGDVGNNEVVLDWAYGDYRWRDWLGIRIGKIKIDYGLYNETREMDMLRTGVMLSQSVYPELWRNSFSAIRGGALYGYLPLGFMGSLMYDGQIGTMEFNADDGFARTFAPRLHETLDIAGMDADYSWFGSLRWDTPLPGLKTKATYYEIQNLKADGDITVTTPEGDSLNSAATYEFAEKNGYVLSLEYTWKDFALSAEYSEDVYCLEVDLEDLERPEGAGSPPKKTSEGWYISGSYRFTDWFELGLTYSEYYPDADNKDGEGGYQPQKGDASQSGENDGAGPPEEKDFNSWLKTTTLSTRFDINEYWVLKLEASYNDGFGGMNLAENPDGEEQYWYLFAAKMTFSF